METLKYLETATSKDSNRYNLNGIWRDLDCMVATDGYRLHIVSGLAMVEKPHFLSGIDADFPDYRIVIPQEVKPLAELKLNKKQLKQLKDYVTFTGKSTISRISIKEDGILLSACSNAITASILVPITEYLGTTEVGGIKASYFYDALVADHYVVLSIGTKEGSPFVIEVPMYQAKAVVMPCHKD